MDNPDLRQTAGDEMWNLALEVRAAWARYFPILITIDERDCAPQVIQALARARSDIERAERHLFSQVDQVIASAKG